MFFRRKLNHDKPLRSPIAFYDIRLSPSNLVYALMFFHEIWSKAYVFLVGADGPRAILVGIRDLATDKKDHRTNCYWELYCIHDAT